MAGERELQDKMASMRADPRFVSMWADLDRLMKTEMARRIRAASLGSASDSADRSVGGLWVGDSASINMFLDGGGSVLGARSARLWVGFPHRIEGLVLIGDPTGSCTLDVKACKLEAYPAGLASICGGFPAVLTAADYVRADVSAWTRALGSGTVVRFDLSGVTALTSLSIGFDITRLG